MVVAGAIPVASQPAWNRFQAGSGFWLSSTRVKSASARVARKVAPVNRAVLESALGLGFKDFEDAVLHEAARHAAVDWIVTRNARDFVGGGVRVCTPGEMLAGMG